VVLQKSGLVLQSLREKPKMIWPYRFECKQCGDYYVSQGTKEGIKKFIKDVWVHMLSHEMKKNHDV
jgi:hypothetical protein